MGSRPRGCGQEGQWKGRRVHQSAVLVGERNDINVTGRALDETGGDQCRPAADDEVISRGAGKGKAASEQLEGGR